ncbi:hypothetical protein ACFSKL_11805 [Belliella marina]|uniref:Uncharacterized protein n=1 Tax=Belliella marina TaxID=1644146 RepID=A0ABW4VMZ1_9BACT
MPLSQYPKTKIVVSNTPSVNNISITSWNGIEELVVKVLDVLPSIVSETYEDEAELRVLETVFF